MNHTVISQEISKKESSSFLLQFTESCRKRRGLLYLHQWIALCFPCILKMQFVILNFSCFIIVLYTRKYIAYKYLVIVYLLNNNKKTSNVTHALLADREVYSYLESWLASNFKVKTDIFTS